MVIYRRWGSSFDQFFRFELDSDSNFNQGSQQWLGMVVRQYFACFVTVGLHEIVTKNVPVCFRIAGGNLWRGRRGEQQQQQQQ